MTSVACRAHWLLAALVLTFLAHVQGLREPCKDVIAKDAETKKGRVEEEEEGVMAEDAKIMKGKVEEEEEAVEQVVEALASKLGSADVDIKPIKGTFQVGESLDKLETKMKESLSIWHDSPPSLDNAKGTGTNSSFWVEAQMTAKHPEAADHFVKTLSSFLADFGFQKCVSATSQGAVVTLITRPFPMGDNKSSFLHAFLNVSKHVHHVDLAAEYPEADIVGLLKNHSDKLFLQEIYKNLGMSIDAGLTPALEDASLDYLLPTEEEREHFKLMAKLFSSLSFGIRLGYNSEGLKEVLHMHSVTSRGLNGTFKELIDNFTRIGDYVPPSLRGHPIYDRGLGVVEAADDDLWRMDSLEVKGLPSGVRVLAKFENMNPFSVLHTLVQESGLDKILRNETVEL